MVCGGVAILLGLVLQPVGQVVGWIAWIFLTYTIEMARLTARFPFASLPVQMAGWMVLVYYAFLGGLTWWLAQPEERRSELWAKLKKPGFAASGEAEAPSLTEKTRFLETKMLFSVSAILLVLAFFVWRGLPDGRLHVVFLDVGQGDAIFIQTPSGRQMLIDGGPSEMALLSQLGRQMPFWDRTLDVMMLTHPESDHVTGLVGVLERYQVDMVIFREMRHESEVYAHWLRLLEAEGATVYRGEAGLRLALDEGADASRPVEMVVLHPGAELRGDANNDSLVARLTYGQVSVLLTGDIEAEVEQRLAVEGATLASTVLKAAHHGSCGSTTQEFLEAVAPEVVVISVGAENRFGHPCAEVLERLEFVLSAASGEAEAPSLTVEGEAPVYRTDERGAIEFITDGSQVWVETEK